MLFKAFKILLPFLVFTQFLSSQESRFTIPNGHKSKLNFQLVNNLIIIPIEINGVELSFLLDSGVSKPILFNIINATDSLEVKNVEKIYLQGLGGGGTVEALRSRNNIFKIGDAINVNQDLFLVFDSSINFTPRLGVNIHGIIGFDFLKDFVVEIKYTTNRMKIYEPQSYKYGNCRKCESFELFLRNNKPYIDTEVKVDSVDTPVKLLVDTGSSDALWLFEDDSLGLKPYKNKYFDDFLGKGLSGNIYGQRSKISNFALKSYELENVNVAYPDSVSINIAKKFKERNGSLGGELLKRFNLIIDYRRAKITFKKNENYKKPFYYNKAGIILEQRGVRVVKEKVNNQIADYSNSNDFKNTIDLRETFYYNLVPSYEVVELRDNSPAKASGMEVGDVILSIGGKPAHKFSLQEVIHGFYGKNNEKLRVLIDRNGREMLFKFELKDPFETKNPQKE